MAKFETTGVRVDLVVHPTKGITFMKRVNGGISDADDAATVLVLALAMAEKTGKPLDMYCFWIEGVEAKDKLISASSVKTALGKLSKAGHQPKWGTQKFGNLRIELGNVKPERTSGASVDDLLKQFGLKK